MNALGAVGQEKKIDYLDKSYIQSVLEKTAKWQLDNPKSRPKNEWTNSVFFTGLFAVWEVTKSPMMYNALMESGKSTEWSPFKRSYHADDIAISSTYIDLYKIEKKEEMLKPSKDTLARFVNEPYPVKGFECIKYWWADALFMAPPVLIKMGLIINRVDYLKYNDKLFHEAYDLLYNKEEHLFARDMNYIYKKGGSNLLESNGKPMFWSRGNGWVLAGLANILKDLPANYPERKFYENMFRDMAKNIVKLQRQDGLWSSGLLDNAAYTTGEVSGSALFCYALAYGVNRGFLKGQSYRDVVQKAWVGLNKCVNADGKVEFVQGAGDRPSKADFSKNSELYGTGAFLLAGSQMRLMTSK